MQTQSITFYSLSKHQGILFKNGDQGVLLSDLKSTDANYKYAVQPCIDSNRVDNLHTAQINENLNLSYLKKTSSLVQFLNNRVLIYDPHLQFVKLSQKMLVDYVYITSNPHSSINFINQNYLYKKLVIDGSNSPQTIKKPVNEADSLHINYALLKRNKSLIVTSN